MIGTVGSRRRFAVIVWAAMLATTVVPQARAVDSRPVDFVDLVALEKAFIELAEQVRPIVVAIRTYRVFNPDDPETVVKVPLSQGSGFIIDRQGRIATNRHVLEEAHLISVALYDGRRFDAKLVKSDIRSDLAVIKIEADDLPLARWGDEFTLKVGQWAFACGNPFGLANENGRPSITLGIVAALGREMTHRIQGDQRVQYYGNLIQTSAPINPGNSGGPLFNIQGEVIGIITAIETSSGFSEGSGFAIPINANTRAILDRLALGEEVRYGYLGVEVRDFEPPNARMVSVSLRPPGVRLIEIAPQSPAAQAGLAPDDIIIEFNGTPVHNSDHLVRLVGFTPVGSQVELTYLRNEVKRKANVTLGDRFALLGVENPDE